MLHFKNWFLVLNDGTVAGPYASLEAAQSAGAITLNIGLFLNTLLSFVIVAFAVFVLIKSINTLQDKVLAAEKKAADKEEAATTKTCPYCCSDIPLQATRCPHCTSKLK